MKGVEMPHQRWVENNKNPKIFFQRYLRNIDEPKDISSNNSMPQPKAELLENSYVMRRRFRLIAKTLRDYF